MHDTTTTRAMPANPVTTTNAGHDRRCFRANNVCVTVPNTLTHTSKPPTGWPPHTCMHQCMHAHINEHTHARGCATRTGGSTDTRARVRAQRLP